MSEYDFNFWSVILQLVQCLAIFGAVFALFLQSIQTRLLRKQVEQSDSAILVATFETFSNMYFNIMSEPPDIANSDAKRIKSWWHRYWDVVVAEIVFYRRGFVDDVSFEYWMQELGKNLHSAPHGCSHMGTFHESIADRKKLIHGIDPNVYAFLDDLERNIAPGMSDDIIRKVVKTALAKLRASA